MDEWPAANATVQVLLELVSFSADFVKLLKLHIRLCCTFTLTASGERFVN